MIEQRPFGESTGHILTPVPGPRSRSLTEELRSVEAPGVTFLSYDFPVFFEEAAGSNVRDVDGNTFVDLSAGFGVASLGHRDAVVTSTAVTQSLKLPHGMGDVHPPAVKVELLQRISELFPGGGGLTLLCTSGSEAVEAALKTARLATNRPGVIAFRGAYHGLSYGTLAVSGHNRFKEPFADQIAKFAHFAQYPKESGDSNPAAIADSLSELSEIARRAADGPHPIGAVLLEPVAGRAGVVVPPPGWLRAVRGFTKEQGLLLIVDEILTGFGRTGARFAVDHEDVVPDLMCLGKALSGMFPISACVGSNEVMSAWPISDGEALHTSTFLGHPVGCAAALTCIDEIERRGLAGRAAEVGRTTMDMLKGWTRDVGSVSQVRGLGMLIGIELSCDGRTGLAFEAARRALAKGVIVLPSGADGNVLSLTPPLTISQEQLDWSLAALGSVL